MRSFVRPALDHGEQIHILQKIADRPGHFAAGSLIDRMALLRKKVKKLEVLQRELTQKIEKLYEDVVDGLLSRDAYTAQKARLVEQRDDAHRAETEIQAEIFEQARDRSIYMERYQLYDDMEVLPDDAIADLLD